MSFRRTPSSSSSRKVNLEDSVRYEEPNFVNKFVATMGEMRREGKLCDVTLCVGDRRFSAHRLVLAAAIPYFRAMFTSGMSEEGQQEIHISGGGGGDHQPTAPGIDPTAIEAFISYAYNGKVLMTMSNVQSLITGAAFLQLGNIKEHACQFMQKNICMANCLQVRKFADLYMCPDLHEQAVKFIRKHFVELSGTEQFLELPLEDVLLVLGDDNLNVVEEEAVFEAARAWIKYDQSRETDLMAVMNCIRFPLMRPPYLSLLVSNDEMIKTSHQMRDLVDEAKDCYLLPEKRSLVQPCKLKSRCCLDVAGQIFVVGGLTCAGESVSEVESFNCSTQKWEVVAPMVYPRSRLGVAVIGPRLFAIGGYDGTQRLSSVECYDALTSQWGLVAGLNTRRSVLGAVTVNGNIFVCGGYNGIASLNTTEIYDPELNEWKPGASMQKSRSAAGCCAVDNKVYAIGGHDGLSIFKSVEVFDFATGAWTLVAPMTSKRCRLGVATLNGRIYVCGGYDGSKFLNTAEVFDPYINAWTPVAPMNCCRSRVTLVANGGRLYALGGYDGTANLNSVEVYHPEQNKWEMTTSMICHEGGVGAAVLSRP